MTGEVVVIAVTNGVHGLDKPHDDVTALTPEAKSCPALGQDEVYPDTDTNTDADTDAD